ncbi:hypothetical protein [Thermus amyloliquefaciens]|uniref:hypothetical protein n=1 Tax=Thermus amyloliquefaciens TaxID=1449080 RepID=UPI00163A5F60|nr:hypothetical protein [Thermus amyloliquefaciens]
MTPVDNLWITLWITPLFLWITVWITCGQLTPFGGLWITGQLSTAYPQAKPSYPQGFSTGGLPFPTAFTAPYPHIHSPYYYGYYPLKVLKLSVKAVRGGRENEGNRS